MIILSDIKTNWTWIKPCLEKLKAAESGLSWIPEDIYASCVYGESRLYIGGEDPDSFMITRIDEDKETKKRTLFIWIAWGGSGHNIMDKYFTDLVRMAQSNNCDTMRMQSPRRGFEKIGWTPTMIDYSREAK